MEKNEILDSNLTDNKDIKTAPPSFPWVSILFIVLGLYRMSSGSPSWGGILLGYGVLRIGYYLYESNKA